MAGRGAAEPDAYIPIAQVDRVRGLRGEVIVTVHADDPGRMARLERVFIKEAEGYRPVAIEGVKRLRERAVLKLSGFGSVEEARGLVGAVLFIPRDASTPAPEGRYYAYQLLGLSARLKDGTVVGTVRDLLVQGAQSLLVIEGVSGGEILVPFVRSICVACEPEEGWLTLDPPAGLLDLNLKGPGGS
ncbi:MAG TPA: ribosome maturation factor RimM [Candidatus Polarisedimenticolia bacterium]|jgi:16S rRNA processing protein RimM